MEPLVTAGGRNSPPQVMSPFDDNWQPIQLDGSAPEVIVTMDVYEPEPNAIIITERRQYTLEGDPIDEVLGSVVLPIDDLENVITGLRNAAERAQYVEGLRNAARS